MPDPSGPLDDGAATRQTSRGHRLLLVDDDPLNRKLATLRLRDAGFDVTVAASAEEALRVATRAPPDVILSDVRMTGMTGYELRRAIRESAPLAHVPVVLLSAADDDPADSDADTLGPPVVIRTPDLRDAIEAVMRAIAVGGDGQRPAAHA